MVSVMTVQLPPSRPCKVHQRDTRDTNIEPGHEACPLFCSTSARLTSLLQTSARPTSLLQTSARLTSLLQTSARLTSLLRQVHALQVHALQVCSYTDARYTKYEGTN